MFDSLYNNEINEKIDWYKYFDKIYYIDNNINEELKYFKDNNIIKTNKFVSISIKLDRKNNELSNFYEEAFITAIKNAALYNCERILLIPNSINFKDNKSIKRVLDNKELYKYDIIILNTNDIAEDCFILNEKAIKYINSLNIKFNSKNWLNQLNILIKNNLKIYKLEEPICQHKIDLVIPFVNLDDKEWQEEYKIYDNNINEKRYRDYNTLNYLLRSVEKNLNFINNLYLIVSSESQIPTWLDTEKIKIVLHKDIIPCKYLPVYNSCTIEMFIPFIKDLSEYFIYTNDDIFFLNKMDKKMFFYNGKSITYYNNVSSDKTIFNQQCINSFRLCMKDFTKEYINNFKILIDSKYKKMFHTAHPFFKSTCLHLHKLYSEDINKSISRFRTKDNLNQYIYGLYDYLSLKTVNKNQGYSYKNLVEINDIDFNDKKINTLCINDNNNDELFDYYIKVLNNNLYNLFNKKSLFELENKSKLFNFEFKSKENKNLKVALCAIAKNENLYIREWVEYYYKLGITNIYIYDNNEIDGEIFEDVINDYIESGFVKVINFRGKITSVLSDKDGMTAQGQAYYDCFYKYGNNYDWMFFFDCDEFLEINNYLSLNNFLNDFDTYEGIRVSWKCYGDNGLIYYDNRGVLERFNTENNAHYSNYIKTILKCKNYDFDLRFCAHGPLNKELNIVNILKQPCTNSYKDMTGAHKGLSVYLKHFYSKSIEEFYRRKYKQTSAVTGVNYKRNFNEEFIFNQFFEYNEKTQEKLDYIDFYKFTFNSVDVYMASLYKENRSIYKNILSILSQPEVKSLTISANNYPVKEIEKLKKEINNDKLKIIKRDNEKLSFEKLKFVNEGTGRYVGFCDDDLFYFKDYFHRLILKCEEYNTCISYHGSNFIKLPIYSYYKERKMFSFTMNVYEDTNVDVIGNGCSLMKRNIFTKKEWTKLYSDAPVLSMDDILISYNLRKKGYKLYVINHLKKNNEVKEVFNNKMNKNSVYNVYKNNDLYQTKWVNKYFVEL